MELKTYIPVGLKFVFGKIRFKVSHYIQHDFIRQRPGLSEACSKALLLTILSSNMVKHSNGYIKGDKYFFFYKNRCGKCSPKTMETMETIYKVK